MARSCWLNTVTLDAVSLTRCSVRVAVTVMRWVKAWGARVISIGPRTLGARVPALLNGGECAALHRERPRRNGQVVKMKSPLPVSELAGVEAGVAQRDFRAWHGSACARRERYLPLGRTPFPGSGQSLR